MQNSSLQISKLNGRIFGIAFIISFLSFGIGFSLIEPITQTSQLASGTYVTKLNQLIAFVLMAIIHAIANITLIAAILPRTAKSNPMLRLLYVILAVSATIILTIASLFVYLIPLEAQSNVKDITSILQLAYFNGYQLSMCLWGLGGIALIYCLYPLKLIPIWMFYWGLIGYAIFICGTLLELMGYPYGLYANIPGGLFEIFLSIYAIKTGFVAAEKTQ